MEKLTTKFMHETAKIKDPIVFFGLARVLKIELMGDGAPRNFEDIYTDLIAAYSAQTKRRKRELFKILRQANKEGNLNADRTENTETSISDEEVQ